MVGLCVLTICEAGKKGGNTEKKRNKSGKSRSARADLNSLDFCRTPSKRELTIQLKKLRSKQDMGSVFIAPSMSGPHHHPAEGTAADDSSPTARADAAPAAAAAAGRGGHCQEVHYDVPVLDRYPVSLREVRCHCVDCVNENEIPNARCDPIMYAFPVLKLSDSQPCFNGLFQYTQMEEYITVGCKYVRNNRPPIYGS